MATDNVSGANSSTPDGVTIELKAARWTLQVLVGIGTAAALIGLGLLLFALFPSLPAREVTPLSLLLVLGLPALAVLGAAHIVNGPRMQLRVESGMVSLIRARHGEVVAACSIEEARPRTGEARVVGRSGTLRFASVGLELPGRRPLVIATMDRQFAREAPESRWGEPTHWVGAGDWIPLVAALGLDPPSGR